MLARDQEQILNRAIANLPCYERDPIELLVYHGCSYQDIATRLDTSVNTIKSRIRRARVRLSASVAAASRLAS
jgi:RNA polymerase sigma factor (sigma-70 family)